MKWYLSVLWTPIQIKKRRAKRTPDSDSDNEIRIQTRNWPPFRWWSREMRHSQSPSYHHLPLTKAPKPRSQKNWDRSSDSEVEPSWWSANPPPPSPAPQKEKKPQNNPPPKKKTNQKQQQNQKTTPKQNKKTKKHPSNQNKTKKQTKKERNQPKTEWTFPQIPEVNWQADES